MWQIERTGAMFRYCGRVFWATGVGFLQNDCFSKAAALTFYLLLSIVPILAIAFGIAKGFGFETFLEETVRTKLFEQPQLAQQIINFSYTALENARTGVIAGVGVLLLLWSWLQLLTNIENYLNEIWQITIGRSLARRLSDYLALLLFCPIFLLLSSSVTIFLAHKLTTYSSEGSILHPISQWLLFGLHSLSYLLNWILFSILYIYLPNTKVAWRYGIIAGLVASIAYQLFQWLYIYFQIGIASYGAIYGSFAALPLFMIWLEISWQIILWGAQLAYATEVLPLIDRGRDCHYLSKQEIGLWIAMRFAQNFERDLPAPSLINLAKQLGTSLALVRQCAHQLYLGGILAQTGAHSYLLAKNPSHVHIKDVCQALEESLYSMHFVLQPPDFARSAQQLKQFEEQMGQASANLSLASMNGA